MSYYENRDDFRNPSIFENRDDYLRNPFFTKHEPGDFSPFYTAIGICTVIVIALVALNVFFCCCSKHKDYWLDPNTGTSFSG